MAVLGSPTTRIILSNMVQVNGTSHPAVGFCGLGAMGYGMATHLLKNGFPVIGYDVFAGSVERFVAAGGRAASTPRDMTPTCKIIILMVSNSSQVDSVLFDSSTGLVGTVSADTVIIVSSTVSPSYWAALSSRTSTLDCHILDCPVSGGTPRAANGTLSIFASGANEGLALAQPALDCLSTTLYRIPGGVGNGSKAKMCHQVMPEVEIALLAEIMAFAAKAGMNPRAVFEHVQAGDGASWINGNRIPHLLDGDDKIYSVVMNSAKDSGIITSYAREVGFPVPLTALSEQVYQECVHRGWAQMDDAHIARLYLPGLDQKFVHGQTFLEPTATSPTATQLGMTFETIDDLFAGANLAISAEAMGFTQAVGLDTTTIYGIISKAAGSNVQFVKRVPEMKAPTWSLRDVTGAESLRRKLINAIHKADQLDMPLPLCSAAAMRFAVAI